MPKVQKELLVPYSAHKMYSLVNDVDKYPEFLPWCSEAQIIENTGDQLTAKLKISYSGFSQELTTCNKLEQDRKITLNLVKGPLKHLTGEWLFDDIEGEGSKIQLKMDFDFDNALLAFTVGKFFQQISEQMIDHFHTRAKAIYG